MRIGLDVSKAQGSADGIGTYCRELLRGLLPLVSDDELHLYALLHPIDFTALEEELGGWPTNVRPRPGVRPAEDSLDVFHSTCWTAPGNLDAPILFTCHDLTTLSHPHFHTLDNKVLCLTGLLRAHLNDATFLAVSQATAAELRHHLEVPTTRIHVVPHAAGPVFRTLDSEEAADQVRRKFQLEAPYLLAVGTLEPRKNLSRLLDAYAALQGRQRKEWPLVLVGGEGWQHQELLHRLETTPELAHARRLGRVDPEDLVALYNGAGLFVYPSLAEGFGLPIVEAMACGAPVVTSDQGAMAETAHDAAVLVDPMDSTALTEALDELIDDPNRRSALRQRGLDHARTFSWSSVARRTLALYHRLAA